jgi:hypothetical protein
MRVVPDPWLGVKLMGGNVESTAGPLSATPPQCGVFHN